MSGTSSLVIDDAVISGNAITITQTYLAVSAALKDLKDSGNNALWVPLAGRTDQGDRVVRAILLHRTSRVNVTLVEDDSTDGTLLDTLEGASKDFFEKYYPNDGEE